MDPQFPAGGAEGVDPQLTAGRSRMYGIFRCIAVGPYFKSVFASYLLPWGSLTSCFCCYASTNENRPTFPEMANPNKPFVS